MSFQEALTVSSAPRLSVVIPMFNEVESAVPMLDSVQSALASCGMPWELIVVDDGSTDGTAKILKAHAAKLGPHIRIIALRRNFRQTAAMQAGIDYARGDVIATLDGDLQNDPADIPRLAQRLWAEDLDLVAGWRVQRQDGWLLRKLPSYLANRLIARVTGLKFQDLGCSLKVFRAPVLKEIRLYGEMHRFIPAWLSTVTSPDRMAEEPVKHQARQFGQSKYGLSRTLRVLTDLLAIHFFLRFGARPGHFFGGIGLLLGAMGSLVLAYLLALKLNGESVGGRPLLWMGFFCVIAGLQFLTTGVLAEILARIYFDGNHARAYHVLPHLVVLNPDEAWHA
jgi:glycosyltransferase involved in cell wall biosynthesis